MERHDPSEAMQTLKKAIEAIATYKQSEDAMFKLLSSQEREVRRIYNECTQRLKAIRKKEKQRARAMFGSVGEEKKDSEKKSSETVETKESPSSDPALEASTSTTKERETILRSPGIESIPDDRKGVATGRQSHSTKRVSFADGSIPGDPDDDYSEPSFFEEHKEALFILTGIAMGCLAMHLVSNRQKR